MVYCVKSSVSLRKGWNNVNYMTFLLGRIIIV